MPCTTILVGKNASYDGSTMTARNDDCGTGSYTVKNYTVIKPEQMPKIYKSVISHIEIPLPSDPLRFTATPNVIPGSGIWAASGINSANVAMTATETITTNPRVLGADPLVKYRPASENEPELAGGIGEEDFVYIVLPFIHSAREGVERLGELLEKYGTYESNGIAFQDVDEIWWFETIGGHHWTAVKVPDDGCVVMPNQLGTDRFDISDAMTEKKNHMCSPDLLTFIDDNHLELSFDGVLNPRDAFGSHDDSDRVYNTPRAWYMLRYLTPHAADWDNNSADCSPRSDNLAWCVKPEKKITPDDIKYLLSSHYQGTVYDPYNSKGDLSHKGEFRTIGINRNCVMSLLQIRPYVPAEFCALEWVAFASNTFNAMAAFYTNTDSVPEYMSNVGQDVSTDNFYWCSRLLVAMADASYSKSLAHIERYQNAVHSACYRIIGEYDRLMEKSGGDIAKLINRANNETSDMLKSETSAVLGKVLNELTTKMKNAYSRNDN